MYDEFASNISWWELDHYRRFRGRALVCIYFGYIGCAVFAAVLVGNLPFDANKGLFAFIAGALLLYGISFGLQIMTYSYYIFSLDEQRYREAPREAWSEWFAFLQRHFNFGMSYFIFLFLCWKLKI